MFKPLKEQNVQYIKSDNNNKNISLHIIFLNNNPNLK